LSRSFKKPKIEDWQARGLTILALDRPSEPSPVTFAFNVKSGKWETINENTPDPVMDVRSLVVTHRGLVIVGGMAKGQQVTPNVAIVKTSPAK